MTQYLLDTNVPSEFTKPSIEPRVERWLEAVDTDNLFLSVMSLSEAVKGITRLPQGKRRRSLEYWFYAVLKPWFEGRILPVSEPIAERFGRLAAAREAQGKPLAVADGLIAATALENRLVLVTRNTRDFGGLGVGLFNPWESAPN